MRQGLRQCLECAFTVTVCSQPIMARVASYIIPNNHAHASTSNQAQAVEIQPEKDPLAYFLLALSPTY